MFSLQSVPTVNAKSTSGLPNYTALRKATKDESSSDSCSEAESAVRSDSNSLKRSFRKRSSSNSEGNPFEDASSPHFSASLSHERLLPPSMYDDDARSASPSTYEKKDLSFTSSFHKEFDPLPSRSHETSPFLPVDSKVEQSKPSEKDSKPDSKDTSPNESPRGNSRTESHRLKRSRSRSRDKRSVRRSRSRSHSRGRQTRSPVRDRRRSRSRDRNTDRDRFVIIYLNI